MRTIRELLHLIRALSARYVGFIFVAAVFYPVGGPAEEVPMEKINSIVTKPELTGLSPNLWELKQAFNEAKGDVRMILLLSPG